MKNLKRIAKNKTVQRIPIHILIYVMLFLAAVFLVAAQYKLKYFGESKIDEIIFYFTNGLGGGNMDSFINIAHDNTVRTLLIFGLISAPIIDFYRNRVRLNITVSRKNKQRIIKFNPSEIRLRYKFIYAFIILSAAFVYGMQTLSVYEYLCSQQRIGTIYEDKYVDPSKVDLQFPDKKRNLIYIFLESIENTVGSKTNGGANNRSYIPELEAMAVDKSNISFSNTNLPMGGALPVYGTTWTVAGMTAQSGGITLKSGLDNNMGAFQNFLPGAYTLGDVLEKEGYNQELIIGSDAVFGGRDKLYNQHGHYNIYDLGTAKHLEKISPDYHVWWGYEDKKLFEYAKEEVSNLSEKDEPFNFQLLTVDTHFVNGYLDPTCPTPYEDQYLNVHACSSKQVYDFVEWIKKQSFYDNTTIILSGDHLGMQTDFYGKLIGDNKDYQRTIYNLIVNSAVPASDDIEYNRMFSTLDMYPTTLAAMGVKIPDEKLGLGVNLFSGEPTLLETYGHDAFDDELSSFSRYYANNIMTVTK